jgi:hypothetical protein
MSTIVVTQPPYNAVGDGIVDDTAALQAALDYFGRGTGRSGKLILPDGRYKITQTLQYEGNPSVGLLLQGELGGTRGPSGTQLVWHGPVGGTMLYAKGINGSTIELLEFHGMQSANIGLHIDARNVEEPGSAGTSGNVLRRLTFGGIVGEESAAIAFGHAAPGTCQVDAIDMYDLVLTADYLGSSYYGIKTFEQGNTKNFKLTGGAIFGFRYGIDWLSASGVFAVHGTIMAGMTVADFRVGAANMHLDSVESETNEGRFVVGSTGANPASLVITNCSWQSATPPDDIMIDHSGHILLQGNTFFNYRTPTSIPIVMLGGNALMEATNTLSGAGITSIGNFYHNVTTGYAPFMDGSGNELLSPTGYYAGKAIAVTSLGDYAGTGGNIVHLKNRVPLDAVVL